jgi:DNA-binding Lrp family transcriptional regulator
LRFVGFCCIITLAEISDKIGKSLRTVKITMKKLQENGIVERVGGKKTGN